MILGSVGQRMVRTIASVSLMAAAFYGQARVYLSPEYMAVSPDCKTLYVTAATAGNLLLVDLEKRQVQTEWRLKSNPSGVATAGDGAIFVTAGAVGGELLKLDPGGKVLAKVAVGHTPLSPVVSADGKTVYVLNRFDNTVMAVDVGRRLKVAGVLAVPREPHTAALGAGGRLLFVANHLPSCRSTDEVVAAAVSVIDTGTFKLVQNVMLPNGSTGVRGMCAAPDGKHIYVTHTFGRYQLPTTQLERGWMNTAGLSVFDGESGEYVNTVLLDDVDLGAANPWGVAVTADGKRLIVAHAGTREISVIDRLAMHERLDRAAKGEKVTEVTKSGADVPNDLSFLVGVRRRVKLEGDGPRGVTTVGSVVYAALYFADSLVSVDLDGVVLRAEKIALGEPIDLSADRVRRGEMLFNDGIMCFQQWQSCASCHPDGRADGLNWDLLNDGIGNPKQTKSMLYSHLTPPTMVTGIRPDMQACNRKGMTHIQFVVRSEEDALCVDEYVMSLKPVPSPYLVKGSLSKTAKTGAKIYKASGCAECHPAEKTGPQGEKLFTNLRKYDLGLGVGNEAGTAFDTPMLVEIWRSGPYLYDGRALTMEELFAIFNPDDRHGRTKDLKPKEIKALAEFILSQ
ncbi:MAG: hypothetical protein PHU80_06535 [Kiritimatiellae bacterium]|nr:hypothetical protein [Kiritimatiellia bacterium]